MPLPELDVARINRWCDDQVPKHLWNEVKVEADVAPTHVTIVEVRAPWDGAGDPTRSPLARLRWNRARHEWSLYSRDRNLRFHLYDRIDPTPSVQTLLDYVGSHEDAIFWG